MVKNPPAYAGDSGSFLDWEDSLEAEMATLSNILVWKILRTEELRGYGLQGHKESHTAERLNTHTFFFIFLHCIDYTQQKQPNSFVFIITSFPKSLMLRLPVHSFPCVPHPSSVSGSFNNRTATTC